MLNPITATCDQDDHDALLPLAGARTEPSRRFAPLFTRPTQLVITAIADELGRPLLGVFVPDGELL